MQAYEVNDERARGRDNTRSPVDWLPQVTHGADYRYLWTLDRLAGCLYAFDGRCLRRASRFERCGVRYDFVAGRPLQLVWHARRFKRCADGDIDAAADADLALCRHRKE